MHRIEYNVTTGGRKIIPLTEQEITERMAAKAAEDAKRAIEMEQQQRKAARQAKLEALLDKIEADPTLLDRIR